MDTRNMNFQRIFMEHCVRKLNFSFLIKVADAHKGLLDFFQFDLQMDVLCLHHSQSKDAAATFETIRWRHVDTKKTFWISEFGQTSWHIDRTFWSAPLPFWHKVPDPVCDSSRLFLRMFKTSFCKFVHIFWFFISIWFLITVTHDPSRESGVWRRFPGLKENRIYTSNYSILPFSSESIPDSRLIH